MYYNYSEQKYLCTIETYAIISEFLYLFKYYDMPIRCCCKYFDKLASTTNSTNS